MSKFLAKMVRFFLFRILLRRYKSSGYECSFAVYEAPNYFVYGLAMVRATLLVTG